MDNIRLNEFKELVRQQFSDDLHENGGDWEKSEELMDEHWENLLEIMNEEIFDLTQKYLNDIAAREENDTDHGLSAAERNPRLT